ncbi:hypothetical protein RND81_14G027700 [Saponaria officinalis]|uniref:Transmembrane protein n=1 Tax=Saponaria officinalis TaxID=3572 RepID=A0AAW1GGV4_SAPOF
MMCNVIINDNLVIITDVLSKDLLPCPQLQILCTPQPIQILCTFYHVHNCKFYVHLSQFNYVSPPNSTTGQKHIALIEEMMTGKKHCFTSSTNHSETWQDPFLLRSSSPQPSLLQLPSLLRSSSPQPSLPSAVAFFSAVIVSSAFTSAVAFSSTDVVSTSFSFAVFLSTHLIPIQRKIILFQSKQKQTKIVRSITNTTAVDLFKHGIGPDKAKLMGPN